MEFPLPLPIRPVVIVVTIEVRRAPNLIFRDVGPEATKAGVVVQLVPRKGSRCQAQEAAEGEDETVSGDCALTARGITFGRSGRDAFYGKRQPWWAKLLKKVGLGSFVKR